MLHHGPMQGELGRDSSMHTASLRSHGTSWTGPLISKADNIDHWLMQANAQPTANKHYMQVPNRQSS